MKLLEVEGEVVPIEWRVEWISFPRAWIEPAIDLFERQRDHFRTEAVRIQQKIETSGPFVSGVRPEQKAENER